MNDWLKKVEEMKKLRGSTTPENATPTPTNVAPQTTQTTTTQSPAKANPFLNKTPASTTTTTS